MEFILDDRQKEIRELLELLGPEPVSYFADACRIMSDTTGLVSQTHLTAHLLREIDARVRGVLRPMLAASPLPALREAAEEDATHRMHIEAAGVLLGLDEPTIKAWVDYAPDLHRFTHRASLAAPRSVTEFRAHFEAGQAVLLIVLRKLQAIYADARPAVRKLAAKHAPGKRDLTTLKDHIPHSDVILGEFFSLATLAWFPRLRDAGYFSSPPPLEIDEEGGVRYVGWPAARFLVRAAASENLREEVVGILEGLDTDNPEARDSTVEAALKMPPTMAARIALKIAHQLEVNELFTRLADEARACGGRLAEWWGERRCLAALDGQAAPDGYGKLLLPGREPAHFLLELDRATEDHERLRQKARRYAKALPRSEFVDDEPLLVFAVPTRARRDGVAAALASSSVPTRLIVWTPQHSPLAALRDALDDPHA